LDSVVFITRGTLDELQIVDDDHVELSALSLEPSRLREDVCDGQAAGFLDVDLGLLQMSGGVADRLQLR